MAATSPGSRKGLPLGWSAGRVERPHPGRGEGDRFEERKMASNSSVVQEVSLNPE